MDYEAVWEAKYAPTYGALAPHFRAFLAEVLGGAAPAPVADPVPGGDANGSPVWP